MDANILIVGAGIGGLSSACEMTKKLNIKKQTLRLFEADREVGGRLCSHHSLDLGAGRFNLNKHPVLGKLIETLSIPVEPMQYEIVTSKDEENDLKAFQTACFSKLYAFGQEADAVKNIKDTFYDLCKFCLGEEIASKFCCLTGYDTLLHPKLSLQLGLKIVSNHPEWEWLQQGGHSKWFRPVNGFQSLIRQLRSYLETNNWHFHLKHTLRKIERVDGSFHLTFQNQLKQEVVARSDVVIMALPFSGLSEIDIPGFQYKKFLDDIVDVPLFKCFLNYGDSWWRKYQLEGKCLVTKHELRKIYFSKTTGELFIYNDGLSANFWREYCDRGEKAVVQKITELLAVALEIPQEEISIPEDVRYRFWKRGVAFWKNDSRLGEEYPNTIEIYPNLFICSDLLTQHSGWIEGALISAESIANQLQAKL